MSWGKLATLEVNWDGMWSYEIHSRKAAEETRMSMKVFIYR